MHEYLDSQKMFIFMHKFKKISRSYILLERVIALFKVFSSLAKKIPFGPSTERDVQGPTLSQKAYMSM